MNKPIYDGMSVTEFQYFHGDLLLKLHEDDPESGDYRLFEDEKHIAAEYKEKGHIVLSILTDDCDNEFITIEINTSPMCVGYFVLRHIKIEVILYVS